MAMAASSSSSSSSSSSPALFFILLVITVPWMICGCADGAGTGPSSPAPSSLNQGDSSIRLDFQSFSLSDAAFFDFVQYSNIQFNALQLTIDTGARDAAITNRSGQITYKKPLRLWNPQYNYIASFNTSFVINMGPTTDGGINKTGGGMVFMLSSRNATDVPNSYGAWLGLVNSTLEAQITSYTGRAKFVAIEFDTFRDPGIDPDSSNHVGINVGSVKSELAPDLGAFNITLNGNVPNAGTNTSVWIDYDGHARVLDIYLWNQNSIYTGQKPKIPVVSKYSLDLGQILPSEVFIGFSASTGTIKETHCVLQWQFNSTSFPAIPHNNEGPSLTLILAIALASSLGLGLILLIATFFYILRRRPVRPDVLQGLSNLSYGPRRFSYAELKKATDGFSDANKLGEGAFGAVYRGKIASTEAEIAVKRLSETSKQGVKEFRAEIQSIGRMRHKNIVHLLGWSYDNFRGRLLLVYDYMPNGSLDRWLYPRASHGQSHSHSHSQSSTGSQPLNWERRHHILRGVAGGLLYLHEEWDIVVIHRDLKPSNIMLDADFNPRLGDFGLAKLLKSPNRNPNPNGEEQQSTRTATVAGTYGYMAPECLETGAITKECDVYSFGAVAMEVVTGRKLSALNLHCLWKVKEEGGELLSGEFAEENGIRYVPEGGSWERKEMEAVLRMSLDCCHPDPACRPTMREIVRDLDAASQGRSGDGDGGGDADSISARGRRSSYESAASTSTPSSSSAYSRIADTSVSMSMSMSMSDLSLSGR